MSTVLSSAKLDERVRIITTGRQLREVGDEAVKALVAANNPRHFSSGERF